MAAKKAPKAKITLVKSTIGRIPKHRATVRALGFRKLNQTIEKELTPMVQGMVDSISFMLRVEEIKK
jgi:large subunit ribosomal protein L30